MTRTDVSHPVAAPPLATAMLSVNALARPLVERLLAQAEALELNVGRDTTGICIVDAGIEVRGSIAAGLKFTNVPDANQYIRRTYRKGWEVKGLS